MNQRRKCVFLFFFLSLSPRFLNTMCNMGCIHPVREESVYIGKEFNSNRITLVYQHVLRFIVSEVKMPCSCYLKAKRFKVVFVYKIIVPVLVIKARCLAYRTYRGNKQGMIGVDLHGPYKACCLLYLSGKYSNQSHGVCLR